MKKNVFRVMMLLMIALVSSTTISKAQMVIDKIDLGIFPSPEKGYKKMVIEVPYSESDKNKKIEFSVGKWMEVDGCNTFNLSGTLEKKDLQGWGYDYYVFKTNGNVASTMMACPNKEKRNLFVSAQPETVRYNGRMPIVIYVPEAYDVQFKIYTTDGDTYRAAEVRTKK
ncbi:MULTISPECIES: ecotin family protein [unclassified Sphingobacterium]|jgi:ecotin|uniref:ecotin family protein n=1 Tax=unclassified Sphingobacterium TaxID=2609468 RepID=UPI001603DB9A|nr:MULTISPECIES: ecotin family protein [unclassified Sphingobacterium]MBB1645505.1 proteinase inhibitor [Sphingobacterium sp. UME9]WET70864.1 MAG: ecotin family protein [Sphingobacterium sp.]